MGVILILLGMAAFAASSETALFSLDRFHLRRLKERHKKAYERIRLLLDHPTKILIVILLINETANLAIANKFTSLIDHHQDKLLGPLPEQYRVLATTLLSTLLAAPLMVIFGEITPKIIASRLNRFVALVNSKLLIVLYKALYPLLWLLDGVITFALRGLKKGPRSHLSKAMNLLDEQDFVEILEEAHREGTLEPSERKLIQKVFKLDDNTCDEIMTPIADAFVLDEKVPLHEALKEIRNQKYSRIPVSSKSRRNIIGILYAKDLLRHRNIDLKSAEMIGEMSIKPMYVSPNVNLSALFRRFKKSKVHIAVVQDANQQAIGIVTMEDVLESIFGEIEDERDIK